MILTSKSCCFCRLSIRKVDTICGRQARCGNGRDGIIFFAALRRDEPHACGHIDMYQISKQNPVGNRKCAIVRRVNHHCTSDEPNIAADRTHERTIAYAVYMNNRHCRLCLIFNDTYLRFRMKDPCINDGSSEETDEERQAECGNKKTVHVS